MFREVESTEESIFLGADQRYFEMPESAPKKVELNENFFSDLELAGRNLSKSEHRSYYLQFEEVRGYMFQDTERLLNMFISNPDAKRVKKLQFGHESLRSIVNLGFRLKEAGVEVPWVNPHWEEYMDKIRSHEITEVEPISPFRSIEDERMVELISRHEALKTALGAELGLGENDRKILTPEQTESVQHIQKEFKELPQAQQNEFTRLITDDDFYHQTLEALRIRQSQNHINLENQLVS